MATKLPGRPDGVLNCSKQPNGDQNEPFWTPLGHHGHLGHHQVAIWSPREFGHGTCVHLKWRVWLWKPGILQLMQLLKSQISCLTQEAGEDQQGRQGAKLAEPLGQWSLGMVDDTFLSSHWTIKVRILRDNSFTNICSFKSSNRFKWNQLCRVNNAPKRLIYCLKEVNWINSARHFFKPLQRLQQRTTIGFCKHRYE